MLDHEESEGRKSTLHTKFKSIFVNFFSFLFFYSNGKPRRKKIRSTRFIQRWRSDRVVSKWYFLTERSTKVYLKIGWNLFGRKKTNNIRFKDRAMKSCEVNIFVSELDSMLPMVHNVNENCLLDGKQMDSTLQPLYHQSVLGVYVGQKRKLIIIEFYKDGMTITD